MMEITQGPCVRGEGEGIDSTSYMYWIGLRIPGPIGWMGREITVHV